MDYDSRAGLIYLHGGDGAGGALNDKTWVYDGALNTWTQLAGPGPSPRRVHHMVFDSGRGVLVLFGGLTAGNVTNGETWEYGCPDCNTNGIWDACDIAAGTSNDADGDGVPDECEICTSPARITSAVSRQITGDIPINIAGRVENGNVTSDPRQCAITEVRICFDWLPVLPSARAM